jgi:diacylglycerol kinase (ATP)
MPTKSKRIVVAVNPSASFGKGKHVGPAVITSLRGMGHTVEPLIEQDYFSLLEAGRKAVASKPDAFVVVGGDGMVNLGTNLVAGTKVPLGIIPSGTGNDMARGLGIPFDNTEEAIRILADALERKPRPIDAGRVSHTDRVTGEPKTTWFGCLVSAGFDAIVNERANIWTYPKGPSRYNLALLYELVRMKPITYRLTMDGVESTFQASLITVANNQSLGGGMLVTPNAKVDDGVLDVLIVEKLSRIAFLRIFPRVYKGDHVRDRRVTITHAKHVIVHADNISATADGETLGPLPAEIHVVPGALQILAPLTAPAFS